MPARHAFLPVSLPVRLHRSDLTRHTREESVHHHPPSLRKVDIAPLHVRVRANCGGPIPFTLKLEGKRALRGFALNLLESALEKNAPVTPLGSALTKLLNLKSFRIRTYEKWRGEGTLLLTSRPANNGLAPTKAGLRLNSISVISARSASIIRQPWVPKKGQLPSELPFADLTIRTAVKLLPRLGNVVAEGSEDHVVVGLGPNGGGSSGHAAGTGPGVFVEVRVLDAELQPAL